MKMVYIVLGAVCCVMAFLVIGTGMDFVQGGVTTATGFFASTTADVTYERGIVRIGWSAMLKVMIGFLALVIACLGLRQVVRYFMASSQGIVDWREAVSRLMLALMAAVTAFWWGSLLIDLVEGVSMIDIGTEVTAVFASLAPLGEAAGQGWHEQTPLQRVFRVVDIGLRILIGAGIALCVVWSVWISICIRTSKNEINSRRK